MLSTTERLQSNREVARRDIECRPACAKGDSIDVTNLVRDAKIGLLGNWSL